MIPHTVDKYIYKLVTTKKTIFFFNISICPLQIDASFNIIEYLSH